MIIKSMAGNEGKFVEIVGDVYPGLPGDLGCFMVAPDIHAWHCRSKTPICNDLGASATDFAVPDTWLRPINDPGDSAQDESLSWIKVPSGDVPSPVEAVLREDLNCRIDPAWLTIRLD